MSEHDIDLVEHLAVLSLQPGDLLVLTYPDELTLDQATRLREQMLAAAPGHDVVVLSGGVQLGAVRKASS